MGKNTCSNDGLLISNGGTLQLFRLFTGKLIDWWFDENHIEQRNIISAHNITVQEILEDKIQRRIDAYFPPPTSQLALKLFSFFRDMEKYAIRVGGMSSHIVGLDQWIIGEIAKRDYNIELQRYLPFFKKYEQKLLQKYHRDMEANN